MRALSLAVLLTLATPAFSQPIIITTDPRLRTVNYEPGRIIPLEGALGYQLTVELSSDEQVQNVAVGDGTAWQVSVNKRGDHLFLKPQTAGVSTNLTVVTTVRVYNFELQSLGMATPTMAYTVRFNYAPRAVQPKPATDEIEYVSPNRPFWYRVNGDTILRPTYVRDDGAKTYIAWAENRSIPAVFAIDDSGQEVLADGMMRDDVMVIDRVVPRLVFRMDKHVARAERLASKRKRR